MFCCSQSHASQLPLPHTNRMAAPGNRTFQLHTARGSSQDLQERVQATPSALLTHKGKGEEEGR